MALKEIKYTAHIIESERGWGRKVDEVKEFDTERERDNFIFRFNSNNIAHTAPDWYMMAQKGPDRILDPERK